MSSQNAMIGVKYPDKYAVEETFQLFKIPWEWYDPEHNYDVIIARQEDIGNVDVPVIDPGLDVIIMSAISLFAKNATEEMRLIASFTRLWKRSFRHSEELISSVGRIQRYSLITFD